MNLQKYQCPNCQTVNVQKLSMAYENGVSVSIINTKNVGIGVAGGKLGVGLGHSGGTSTTKTELSKKLEPPEKKSMISIIVYCIIGMAVVGKTIGWGFFTSTITLLVVIGSIWERWDYINNIFPQEMEKWNRQYLCLVCGTRFYEDGTIETEEKKSEEKIGVSVAFTSVGATATGTVAIVEVKAGETPVAAPIPGTVSKIIVKPGQIVEKGDFLMLFEAMGMQNEIGSPAAGTVKSVNVNVGEDVRTGQVMMVIA